LDYTNRKDKSSESVTFSQHTGYLPKKVSFLRISLPHCWKKYQD